MPPISRLRRSSARTAALLLATFGGATAGVVLADTPRPAPVAPPEPPPLHQLAIPSVDDGLPGVGPIRRHSWFQNLWMSRRGAWSRRLATDQGAVVFLGDSITQGLGDDFQGLFPGLKAANRGISGDTTRGVLLRLDWDVIALNPAAVVLLIGTNDLEEAARPESITANLSATLNRLKQRLPTTPIVVCEVLPSSPSMRRGPELIRDLNARYRAAVQGDPQIRLLDTWTLFANAEGNARAEEMPDLLHPNALGYQKWAAAVRPVLATLGLMETEPDTWSPEPGFTSLFNGRDLTGWGYRPTSAADRESARGWQAADPNAAAWPFVEEASAFDGLATSPDGRFAAINDRLVVTLPPEGRKIQQLWTTREITGDFVLKLEFRATPNADSGVYVRGPQLQCRDYTLAGPWHDLPNYRPQDWNELVIEVRGGQARATCNGDLLVEAMPVPSSGPIGLEGDRGQMEYRRIRYQPL